jgi:multicomponent Na+:H+ antiporter subunit E
MMTNVWMPRFGLWYAAWLILTGWSPWDAVVGIPAAALATWAGGILLPPAKRSLALLRVARFTAGFLWQSVAAGLDVAWRVFQPEMPLHPGIVRVAPRLPAGTARLWFLGLASLQPGSLACGVDEEGFLLFHCLDSRGNVERELLELQDVLLKLWEEENG